MNGKPLGLHAHVEEIKRPFLARRFDSAEGNLYEGTASDFTRDYQGTLERKRNEDADDGVGRTVYALLIRGRYRYD